MVEIAPEVDVEPIPPVAGVDGPPVADDAGHDAEDLRVGDAVLAPDIVVAADNVVVRADFQDAVEDVLVATLVEDGVVALAAGGGVFAVNFDDVAALADEWDHGSASIGVNYIVILFQQFFKSHITNE